MIPKSPFPEGLSNRPKLPGVREAGEAYQVYSRQVAYDGRYIKVLREQIRLPNGHEATHEIVRHPGAVTVIPVLEEKPGVKELVLVEQFRTSVGGFIHEIPAGILEPGEDPLACARRELEEETGYTAERWTHVASLYPTPGIAAEPLIYFLAEGLKLKGGLNLDPGEVLTVKRFPLDRLIDSMVFGKKIEGIPLMVDGKTHLAVFYLGAYHGCTKR